MKALRVLSQLYILFLLGLASDICIYSESLGKAVVDVMDLDLLTHSTSPTLLFQHLKSFSHLHAPSTSNLFNQDWIAESPSSSSHSASVLMDTFSPLSSPSPPFFPKTYSQLYPHLPPYPPPHSYLFTPRSPPALVPFTFDSTLIEQHLRKLHMHPAFRKPGRILLQPKEWKLKSLEDIQHFLTQNNLTSNSPAVEETQAQRKEKETEEVNIQRKEATLSLPKKKIKLSTLSIPLSVTLPTTTSLSSSSSSSSSSPGVVGSEQSSQHLQKEPKFNVRFSTTPLLPKKFKLKLTTTSTSTTSTTTATTTTTTNTALLSSSSISSIASPSSASVSTLSSLSVSSTLSLASSIETSEAPTPHSTTHSLTMSSGDTDLLEREQDPVVDVGSTEPTLLPCSTKIQEDDEINVMDLDDPGFP